MSSAGDSGTESPLTSFSPGLDIEGTKIIIGKQKQQNNKKKQQEIFNELQLANNLTASLTIIEKNDLQKLQKIDNIWTQNNENIIDFNRRVSGSSLGSSGIGKSIVGTSGTNSSASFASTSISSSSDEFWPIHQQKTTQLEQQQNFSRLPIFEQLSNCPF